MKKIIAVLLSLCLGVSFLVVSAQGSRFAGPRQWELEFEEYDRIFISAPRSSYYGNWWLISRYNERFVEERVEERIGIRTGLYYNTDPLVSIYYVDDGIDEGFEYGTVYFSRDGSYFVVKEHLSAYRQRDTRDVGLSFFTNGQHVLDYTLGDLIENIRSLEITSAGIWWYNWQTVEHNQQDSTLSLTTIEGRQLTFDITTGEIIDPVEAEMRLLAITADRDDIITDDIVAEEITAEEINGRFRFLDIAIGVGVLILTAAIIFVWRRWRRRILSDRK